MDDQGVCKKLERRPKPIGRDREPALFSTEVIVSVRALDLWDAILELETLLWCSPNVEGVYFKSGEEAKSGREA